MSFVGNCVCAPSVQLVDIHHNDYVEFLEEIWEPLVEKAYSFIIQDDSNQIIGVSLNFDIIDEPERSVVSSPLSVIFKFLDFIEVPIK